MLLSSSLDSFVQFITVLLMFVLVFGLCYFVTRWVAKYQKGTMVAKNMTVIDTMRISPSQCIQIVRIGEQYLAIAVSKDQVTLLTKLDEDELIIKSDGEETTPLDFSTVWESIKNTKGSKEKSNEEEETFIKNND